MAAGSPGQWSSVILVAAQVHTRVRFLFLSSSIYLSPYFWSLIIFLTFFSLTFVILIFSLLKKKIYILFFHSNFSLIIFLTFSLFFFNFHLSSLLIPLNNFFFSLSLLYYDFSFTD